MSDIDLAFRLELALVCYLWTFGGKIDPSTIAKSPELFDNLAGLAQNPLTTGTPFDGATWFLGHGNTDLNTLPRIIVTVAQAGGDLSYAGNDLHQVEIVSVSGGNDLTGHARLKALRAITQQDQVPVIVEAISPPVGTDERIIQGIGLDGLEYVDQVEGRDEKKNQHGARLNLNAVAHLE